ncbi:hypothetical protein LCGC14_0353620 [marine sediment metagenome]|uniref:Uncharacterized protein n=1 Tax=marine sediment metagenome TaxID=412755 RepID=A0A0F9TA65_9ZZZZ
MDERLIDEIMTRIRLIEANGRSEVSGSIEAITFANLPAPGQPGRLFFVTDGLKIGEGGGAGTGTPAYDDGVAFRRTGDDTTVAV